MLHVSWIKGLNGLELKIQIKTDILLVLTWVQTVSCADPGIFVRGGPGQSDNVFFSPHLILQKSNGQFQRNLSFFKVPDGGPTFSRGGGGGVQLHIPYRNSYNL